MAASTGPILGAGAVTVFNAVIVQGRLPQTQSKVIVGTLIAAGGLALLEAGFPTTAVTLSWTILLVTLLVRTDPATPSPIESFQQWLNSK